jgi:glycerol uptake facilitator-like aquaporin
MNSWIKAFLITLGLVFIIFGLAYVISHHPHLLAAAVGFAIFGMIVICVRVVFLD